VAGEREETARGELEPPPAEKRHPVDTMKLLQSSRRAAEDAESHVWDPRALSIREPEATARRRREKKKTSGLGGRKFNSSNIILWPEQDCCDRRVTQR